MVCQYSILFFLNNWFNKNSHQPSQTKKKVAEGAKVIVVRIFQKITIALHVSRPFSAAITLEKTINVHLSDDHVKILKQNKNSTTHSVYYI